jgi:Ras-related protein Rab-1A
LTDEPFTESYLDTVGVDFRFRNMLIGERSVKLQIWDTAGHERFRRITSAYYNGADGIVLVYDVCNRASFADIDNWFKEISRHVTRSICKLLIGTKCDKTKDRQVSTEEAQRKAEELGMAFVETSAKDATNVDAAFQIISKDIMERSRWQGYRSSR